MIRAVQEFFGTYGRCRELCLADGPHYPVLLSIEQLDAGIEMPGAGAIRSPALRIRYRGHKEDLIVHRCISRERLAAVRHGRYENDTRGATLHVESKAAPGRRGMIELSYLTQSRLFAGMLPGVSSYCGDWLQALKARPLLRLVVDNTASLRTRPDGYAPGRLQTFKIPRVARLLALPCGKMIRPSTTMGLFQWPGPQSSVATRLPEDATYTSRPPPGE